MEEETLDLTKKSDEKGEYTLDINPLALIIPFGLIGGGVSLFFVVKIARFQMLGLFLALIGSLSLLGIAIPVVQLLKAKRSLEEQERKVKLERIKESIGEKTPKEEAENE